jgi:guanylate kinase
LGEEAGPPLLLVVSGPSGVGKDVVLDRILESTKQFVRPVTMTTRAPRPSEMNGRDYIFVTDEEFRRHLEAGELLEHAEIYGKGLYGLPRAQLRRALEKGDAILRMDVQGVASLRELLPTAVFVMLVPDSLEHLERHLRARGEIHDETDRARRLAEAEREMQRRDLFDHVVVNVEGDLDTTVERVLRIAEKERRRPGRKPVVV